MTNEITVAMEIARWVAIWHLIVALYLVAYSEVKTPFLMLIAVMKAGLGALIYLLVLEPAWVLEADWPLIGSVDGILLPLTLLLLGAVSVVLSWALWQLYEIGGPVGWLIGLVLGWVARAWDLIVRAWTAIRG